MKEFTRISRELQDAVVKDFLGTIGNLKALHLECPDDLDELADAIEVIGLRIRGESTGRGTLMLAKAIIDRAISVNR